MSILGKHVVKVGETPLLSDQLPLLLYDGDLSVTSGNGKLSSITLSTHVNSPTLSHESQLKILMDLRKYSEAFTLCKEIADYNEWIKLGNAAIADLEIRFGKT